MSALDDLVNKLPWKRTPPGNRTIYMDHYRSNKEGKFCSNRISTSKYNVITFLPKNLLEQFLRLANLYFLIICLIQIFSGLSPTGKWGTVVPLGIIVFLQMLKDIYEDFHRYRSDQVLNNQKTTLITKNTIGGQQINWDQVKVGDVIQVFQDEPIPADLIFLSSNSPNSKCFVETSQLDGEANLKTKDSVQLFLSTPGKAIKIECEGPNKMLYEFNGNIESESEHIKHPLTCDNLLLRGSTLKNTDWIQGVVVYTGKHTRVMMNSRQLPHKSSKLESLTNHFVIWLFIVQVAINLIGAAFSVRWVADNRTTWYVMRDFYESNELVYVKSFINSFMLYGQFVPLALYATLEIVRLFQTRFQIEQDVQMYHDNSGVGLIAKSSSLTDDLGQVEFLFADKTGTLTCNKMKLVGVALPNGKIYDDLFDCDDKCNDLFRALSICHSATADNRSATISYQCPSPDEFALVTAAAQHGFRLLSGSDNIMTIQCAHNGKNLVFDVMCVLEFSFERKCMSIIVKDRETDLIHLFCKGADSVLLPKLIQKGNTNALDFFSNQGLRTLVVAHRQISPQEYDEWYVNHYVPASTHIGVERALLMQESMQLIEINLNLLGVTAIEDKLQEQVPETIEKLCKAGVKVWMLTGDKQETAVVIGRSCRILQQDYKICILSDCKNITDLLTLIIEEKKTKPDAVVIDGSAFQLLIDNYKNNKGPMVCFLQLCISSKRVICCRVSPDQKAFIVSMVRKYIPSCITLAIGDGANDVGMIRTAHLGVGIIGQEGRQASNASDYSFAQFKYLSRLLLVHGRWNYRRISKVILFSIYKSIAVNFMQVWFFLFNGASGSSMFEPFILTLYYTVFTGLPIGFYGLLDKDVKDSNLVKFPELYTHGSQNYHLNFTVFFCYTLNSFYHSFLCFFVPYMCYIGGEAFFHNGYSVDLDSFGLASYTSVLVVTTLKLALETSHFTIINHLVCWGSLLSFFVVTVVYCAIPGPFYLGFMNSASTALFWLTIILTVVACLLRDIFWKACKRNVWLFRQLYHKLQEYDRLNQIPGEDVSYDYTKGLQPPVRRIKHRAWFFTSDLSNETDTDETYDVSINTIHDEEKSLLQ
ncbi:phospholipid-transporting ATPase [Acrasis kona]|uniref:Phospholipid-transporting ATPase n=1 Tax=Acrasis kona TaxID=1008807 RepID=A0AAW2ZIR7_9EUKA